MSVRTNSIIFSFCVVLAFLGVAIFFAVQKEKEQAGSLPAGVGKSEVEAHCLRCHDVDIMFEKNKSVADWEYTIDRMEREQNIETLNPEIKKTILHYLTTHFGEP